MISLIGQVLLALGLAAVAFLNIPHDIYLIVGALAALVAGGLMFAVEGEHLEFTIGYVLSTIGISLMFGAFWPALPAIVVWGGVKRRRAESQKARAAKDNPSPSNRTSH
jgi:hypothetical protein